MKRKDTKTYSRQLLFLLNIFLGVLSTLRRDMICLHLEVFAFLSICITHQIYASPEVFSLARKRERL
jgi:hypothetical protein